MRRVTILAALVLLVTLAMGALAAQPVAAQGPTPAEKSATPVPPTGNAVPTLVPTRVPTPAVAPSSGVTMTKLPGQPGGNGQSTKSDGGFSVISLIMSLKRSAEDFDKIMNSDQKGSAVIDFVAVWLGGGEDGLEGLIAKLEEMGILWPHFENDPLNVLWIELMGLAWWLALFAVPVYFAARLIGANREGLIGFVLSWLLLLFILLSGGYVWEATSLLFRLVFGAFAVDGVNNLKKVFDAVLNSIANGNIMALFAAFITAIILWLAVVRLLLARIILIIMRGLSVIRYARDLGYGRQEGAIAWTGQVIGTFVELGMYYVITNIVLAILATEPWIGLAWWADVPAALAILLIPAWFTQGLFQEARKRMEDRAHRATGKAMAVREVPAARETRMSRFRKAVISTSPYLAAFGEATWEAIQTHIFAEAERADIARDAAQDIKINAVAQVVAEQAQQAKRTRKKKGDGGDTPSASASKTPKPSPTGPSSGSAPSSSPVASKSSNASAAKTATVAAKGAVRGANAETTASPTPTPPPSKTSAREAAKAAFKKGGLAAADKFLQSKNIGLTARSVSEVAGRIGPISGTTASVALGLVTLFGIEAWWAWQLAKAGAATRKRWDMYGSNTRAVTRELLEQWVAQEENDSDIRVADNTRRNVGSGGGR